MSNVSNEFLSVLGKDSEKYHFQASQAKKLKKLGMLHQHVQKTTSLTVLAVVLIDNIYNCMLKSEFTKTYEKYDIHTYVHISRKKKFGERVGFPKSDEIGRRQVGRSKISENRRTSLMDVPFSGMKFSIFTIISPLIIIVLPKWSLYCTQLIF